VKLLDCTEVAERLKMTPRSVGDKRCRANIGLKAIKIGRLLRFSEEDVDRLIRKSRERLPAIPEENADETN
jgi:hypothetical protein